MPSQRSVNRILLNVALDGVLAAVATLLARYIADPGGGLLHPLWFLAGGAITLLVAGLPFRMPQQYWRFAGIEDLLGLVGSSVVSAALFALLLRVSGFPLPTPTFPVVHALTLIVALGTPRVVYRLRLARRAGREGADAQSVLLVGAGDGADLFMRALEYGEGRAAFRIVGLLSMREGQTGRRIHGHTILGSISQTTAVLARLRAEGRLPSALVVTQPALSGAPLAALLAQADVEGVPVRRVPRPTALQTAAEGGGTLELAPVAIEDLLNRPQVPLDRDGMARLVHGRRVLVTGAGGTIGSELARQLAALGPDRLTLLDNGEYALWQIDQELHEAHPGVPRETVIADIRDEPRIRAVFDRVRPELVFHAAALKHVPMVEANPLEGLLTNALGTRHVAEAARAAGANAMVFISTDKAVNPSSVMGASKRLAEMYCQALDVAARRGGRHALRHRTLRQCAGQHRLRRAAVPPSARARRPADGHPSRHAALFHDGAGGGGAGAAGKRARHGRHHPADRRAGRHLRVRHGRAGAHRRSGAADDPARRPASGRGRTRARPHPDPLHRPSSRREAI